MADAKHTPGPWEADPDDIKGERDVVATARRANGGYIVARLYGPDRVANGRLIAAAPELLSLLQDAVESFGPHLEGGDEWLKYSRAAIAKATGQRCCPECGNEDLEREEGTEHCLECGHTWSAA